MTDLRKCIGSAKFGIEAHEAPPEDFPSQPSQKDGLGRMCKPHWNEYTRGLARDRRANKAADGATGDTAPGRKTEAGTCPYTVGKRTCVAGATGHAGPHEWPGVAERKAALREELQAILA